MVGGADVDTARRLVELRCHRLASWPQRCAVAARSGPMSHCRPGPADRDCSPRQQPRRRTNVQLRITRRPRRRRRSRPPSPPLPERSPRTATSGSGDLHPASSTAKLKLSAEDGRHRGRVRGRPEPQRRPLEGDPAPQRLARRHDDRDDPGPERIVHRAPGRRRLRGVADRIVAVATSRSGATCRAAGSF